MIIWWLDEEIFPSIQNSVEIYKIMSIIYYQDTFKFYSTS
jgi:hypothetical protein